jgi:hypothetical protein
MTTQVALPSALSPGNGNRAAGGLLALLLAGGLLAGCGSSDPSGTGPLGNGGPPAELCAPVPHGGVLTDGIEALRNSSSSAAMIEKISLVAPVSLRILASYVVPVTGQDLYGVRSGFPPARNLDPGIRWSQHRRAEGARILHSGKTGTQNLLVVLKPLSATSGSAKAMDISYEAAGQQYQLRIATALKVEVGRNCSS